MKTHPQGKDTSTAEVPVYHTEDNRAALMSIYQEKLRQWPVPCQTFSVATRYGKTHVIASGDPASPPVILLHPEATSALAWSPLFPALAGRYRIYTPDTIGDVGRSELDDFDVYPKNGARAGIPLRSMIPSLPATAWPLSQVP